MTGRTTAKAQNIGLNPQVALHWETNDDGDGLLVQGRATIHDDIETKTRLWTGVFDYDLSEFAPDGPELRSGFFWLSSHPVPYTLWPTGQRESNDGELPSLMATPVDERHSSYA